MYPSFTTTSAVMKIPISLSLSLMSLEMKYLKQCSHSSLMKAQDLMKYIPNYLKK